MTTGQHIRLVRTVTARGLMAPAWGQLMMCYCSQIWFVRSRPTVGVTRFEKTQNGNVCLPTELFCTVGSRGADVLRCIVGNWMSAS